MSTEFDQDGLISIFVLEANDGLKALWHALHPDDGSLPTPESLHGQFILAHRVKGAAYQYGFTDIAELGDEMETTLESLDADPGGDWERMVEHLRDLVRRMQAQVDTVANRQSEGAGSQGEAPVDPLEAPPIEGVGGEESVEERPSPASGLSDEYLIPNLDEEVMEYFAPEAQEYLDTIEAALLRLEKDPRDAETIQTLFRTAHTLKGSAYTVGCDVVGDVAHPLEDLMGAIRDAHLGMTASQLDAILRAVDVIRLLMRRDPSQLEQMREKVSILLETLRHTIAAGPGAAEPVPEASEPDSSPDPIEPAGDMAETGEDRAAPLRLAQTNAPEQPTEPEKGPDFVQQADVLLTSMETALHQLHHEADAQTVLDELVEAAQALGDQARDAEREPLAQVGSQIHGILTELRGDPQAMTTTVLELLGRALQTYRLLVRLDRTDLGEAGAALTAILEELRQPSADTAAESRELGTPVREPQPRRADQPGPTRQGATGADEATVVRVSHDRLERLLNLVGELVIGRGRLDQRLKSLEELSEQVMAYRRRMLDTVRTFEDKYEFTLPSDKSGAAELDGTELAKIGDFGALEFDKYDDFNILSRRVAEVAADVSESMSQLNASIRQAREDMSQLGRLTTTMRNEIARTRMVPIGTPFLRFRRAVRELARTAGKEVTLVTSGEQTEVDSSIVDRLVDPLIHMVRNAVYHGIEPPHVRVSQGKPSMGTVSLRALHHGSRVLIQVEDDGAGLHVEKIKARAVAMGLVDAGIAEHMSKPEIINFIFHPGMSTAESVGQTAGRGIGMDVVKQTIEGMNGHIEVETEPGRRTTFVLELPLTLLVTTALLVRVGELRYAIPLPAVREVVLPAPGELQTMSGRTILQLYEETIEVESLSELLHGEPSSSEGALPVVIARTPTGSLGLVVDELLGRQEIVIKGLGTLKPLQRSCFGGASIDPEGRVILVLDVGRLLGGPALEDRGASVRITAPMVADAGDGEEVATDQTVGPAPILLIDDSLSIRKFVGRMLESAGFRVDTAVDGEEGLRKIAATQYSLIITDLEMPKVNGYEVLQALRGRPHTQNLPVIVMTTRAGEKHRHMALTMGASAYVAKPVEERALIAEVSRWVGQVAGTRR